MMAEKGIVNTLFIPLRIIKAAFRGLKLALQDAGYRKQLQKEVPSPQQIEAIKKEIDNFTYTPKISVVVPVYNIEREWLTAALDSVIDQYYPNWELCIADDASPKPHIKGILKEYEKKDNRIKVVYLEKNRGMSGSSNAAMELTTGEYVALLDHDDELSVDSLYEVVKLLQTHREAELIFSDEDKLSMSGKRLRPVRKNGWDPALLLTYNYICHLVVCRTEIMKKAGGFRKGFEGSQDYDLLLRVTEITDNIFHIPKILYHWRMIPGSAAMVVDAKREAFEKSKRALREAMQRRGISAEVIDSHPVGTFKVIPKASSPCNGVPRGASPWPSESPPEG
ncbi:MAG: glycosyltransferase, partial [bacterium]|nr:glycosyltransferase [bacterium]